MSEGGGNIRAYKQRLQGMQITKDEQIRDTTTTPQIASYQMEEEVLKIQEGNGTNLIVNNNKNDIHTVNNICNQNVKISLY